MKLYDRISGTLLNRLPDLIHPGRYVLGQAVSFNGHTQLASGDLLSDDGSERCVLDQETARFCGFDAALGDDTVFLSRVLPVLRAPARLAKPYHRPCCRPHSSTTKAS